MSVLDEMEVVKSIYCQKGEFEAINPGSSKDKSFKLNLMVKSEEFAYITNLQVVFHLPERYPAVVPRVTILFPVITKEGSRRLNDEISNFLSASDLLNNEMLVESILWVKDNFTQFTTESSCENKLVLATNDEKCDTLSKEVCVFQLDHMRSKNNYVKTLQKWASQLLVDGVIIFYKHLIFIVLCGGKNDIKGYLKRMRTQKVDVDSSGHACKERLLTILSRDQYRDYSSTPLLKGLEICEPSSIQEMEKIFVKGFPPQLFVNVIKPLVTKR